MKMLLLLLVVLVVPAEEEAVVGVGVTAAAAAAAAAAAHWWTTAFTHRSCSWTAATTWHMAGGHLKHMCSVVRSQHNALCLFTWLAMLDASTWIPSLDKTLVFSGSVTSNHLDCQLMHTLRLHAGCCCRAPLPVMCAS
jgi:hypothetical protein